MKKLFALLSVAALPSLMQAQYVTVQEKVNKTYTTTTKKIQEVDSRMCDVVSNAIFKPLVVTMDIIGERQDKTYPFTADTLAPSGGCVKTTSAHRFHGFPRIIYTRNTFIFNRMPEHKSVETHGICVKDVL